MRGLKATRGGGRESEWPWAHQKANRSRACWHPLWSEVMPAVWRSTQQQHERTLGQRVNSWGYPFYSPPSHKVENNSPIGGGDADGRQQG